MIMPFRPIMASRSGDTNLVADTNLVDTNVVTDSSQEELACPFPRTP